MTEQERKDLIHWQHEIDMVANQTYMKKLRARMAEELKKAAFPSEDGESVLLAKAEVLNDKRS